MASHLTLLTGRAGSGKTERLLAEYRVALEDARRQRRLGTVLWLAPTRRAQQAVVERLLSPTQPVQLAPQVLTFDVFAEQILAAAGHPATPMSPVMKRLMLRRIVAELHGAGMLSSFSPVIRTSGFLDVVSSFISELKREEIWPEDFLAACSRRSGNRSQRDAELGRIYERYQACLTEQNWYDNEGRFWLACSALSKGVRGPFAAIKFLAVDGFADFTRTQYKILGHLLTWIDRATITLPMEQPTSRTDLFAKPTAASSRLLEHLPDGVTSCVESLSAESASLPNSLSKNVGREGEAPAEPREASGIEHTDGSAGASPSLFQQASNFHVAGLLRISDSLFANPRAIEPTNDASGLELIAATGPAGECEAVARRIKRLLEEGVAPKEIVIALRSLAEDGPAWRDFLAKAGIPVWCEAKPSLTASPVVKALFATLQLEHEDWPFARLMSVLDSNLFQPEWPELQQGRAVRAVAASLRRLKLHAERELLLRVLSRVSTGLLKEVVSTSENDDDELSVAESSAATLAALAEPLLSRLSRTTEQLRRKHTLVGWADVLATLGEELGWSRGVAGAAFNHVPPPGLPRWSQVFALPADSTESEQQQQQVVQKPASHRDKPSGGANRSTVATSGIENSNEARDWDLLQRIVRTAAEADEKLIATPRNVTSTGKSSRKLPLLDLTEFTAELRDLLSGETIPGPADPGGCVRVLNVEQVRHLSVPHLFVVGLSESSFPQKGADDCLFGDAERRELAERGLALRHREQHQQDEMFLFYNLMTKARTRLTLSYPSINRKGQTVFASPYVSAIRTLFTEVALPVLHEGQLDPIPTVDRALTATDLRLVAMTEARAARPGLFTHLLAQPEWHSIGENLLAAVDVNVRRFHTRGFTNHEGRLQVAQNLESLRKRFGSQHQFSATELEGYATCPFRFWLGKVLKLDPIPTPEEGTDHAARGSLIHDVLARLLTEGMDGDAVTLAARFRELAAEQLATRFHETDLQRALTRIESELLGLWGDAFAEQQVAYQDRLSSAWSGLQPSLAPEIPFGSLPDAELSPGEEHHEPIVFGEEDRAVRVRGRIDRVDVGTVGGKTVFSVIDYKTGKPPKSNETELQTGRAIQLALYTLAVRRLGLAGPAAEPFVMGYWPIKETGFKRGYQRETKVFDGIDSAIVDSLEQSLNDLIPKLAEGLRSGKFLVENADEDCTGRCPYRTTCRVNQLRPVASSLHKIGDILM